MVDLSDPKSHEKFSVDVKLLLIPGALLFLLVGKLKQLLLLTDTDITLIPYPYSFSSHQLHLFSRTLYSHIERHFVVFVCGTFIFSRCCSICLTSCNKAQSYKTDKSLMLNENGLTIVTDKNQ